MSQKYELPGKIKLIGDIQTFPSGFQKRELVVTTADEKYPQDIKLEAVKDDCTKLDKYAQGDDITVHFNLRGNEYNGKYYVSLAAWKFDGKPSGGSPRVAEAAPDEPSEDIDF